MERIAIIDGIRTPFSKAGGALATIQADDLGAIVVRELLMKTGVHASEIDNVFIGNVAQPAHAANIARVIALKGGIPKEVPAATVHRNCASGMESISQAAKSLWCGESKVVLAGGTESMSNIPLLFNDEMKNWFENLYKCKTIPQRLAHFAKLRPHHFAPVIGVLQGLTDPVCNLLMGMTAENVAREFHISREEQDQFALKSHQRAVVARDRLTDEIIPVPLPPKYTSTLQFDDGPRDNQSLAALAKLKPYFDRKNGTVTVGNACPITDGAAMVILMTESEAKSRGLKPIGYVKAFSYAGLDPHRMGLGPVYATAKLFDQTGLSLSDIQLIELNEAFAAQVIGNMKAFESDQFAQTHLNRPKALGAIDPDLLNVNGGAIATGHPVGTSGTRIVVTALKEMARRNLQTGLATLCIGGGQGAAFIVERE